MLKKSVLACLGTLAAVALAASPAARADVVLSGTFNVTDWTGAYSNGITDNAALPAPSLNPTATFTYTGPINFANGNPNTFGNFFDGNAGGISNFTGGSTYNNPATTPNPLVTLSDFLGTIMSTPGETGTATNSYLEFTGAYTAPLGTDITVTHDDGASLYVDGSAVLSDPGPTTTTPTTGTLPSGTHNFNLVYVESNGAPAVLQTTTTNPVNNVPEPGSLALLGTGLVMAGLLTRRRNGKLLKTAFA